MSAGISLGPRLQTPCFTRERTVVRNHPRPIPRRSCKTDGFRGLSTPPIDRRSARDWAVGPNVSAHGSHHVLLDHRSTGSSMSARRRASRRQLSRKRPWRRRTAPTRRPARPGLERGHHVFRRGNRPSNSRQDPCKQTVSAGYAERGSVAGRARMSLRLGTRIRRRVLIGAITSGWVDGVSRSLSRRRTSAAQPSARIRSRCSSLGLGSVASLSDRSPGEHRHALLVTRVVMPGAQ